MDIIDANPSFGIELIGQHAGGQIYIIIASILPQPMEREIEGKTQGSLQTTMVKKKIITSCSFGIFQD